MMQTIYLNGEYVAPEAARISVMDRGFLFGDGVYEVIPAYGGKLFRLSHHLDRLNNSLQGIRMENPHTQSEWTDILETLVNQSPGVDQSVYLQVTRGVSEIRDHAIPDQVAPTVFAMCSPLKTADPALSRGVDAFTLEDTRWQHCNIKAVTLLANVLLRQQAIDMGGVEAILIRDGLALEGAASNLFMVDQGAVITPPKSRFLLPGITRDLILEIAAQQDIPWREEEIPVARLHAADEIWLTSSTKEIIPVTRLNGSAVGNGEPGTLFLRMAELFKDYRRKLSDTPGGNRD